MQMEIAYCVNGVWKYAPFTEFERSQEEPANDFYSRMFLSLRETFSIPKDVTIITYPKEHKTINAQ